MAIERNCQVCDKVEYWLTSCFAWIRCLLSISVFESSLIYLTSSLFTDTKNLISGYSVLQQVVAVTNEFSLNFSISRPLFRFQSLVSHRSLDIALEKD